MTTFDIQEEGYIIRNAKITKASLFLYNDNLCYQLEVTGSDFSGTINMNSLGSVKLKKDDEDNESLTYLSSGICGAAIMHILNICGVSSWDAVNGSYIRVAIKNNEIVMFGHIILENMWLNQDYLIESSPEFKEFP